jgi:predicted phosphate transport protein (TIGR00153 family)
MRFSLIPREQKFFDMFDELTGILNRASEQFLTMVTEFSDLPAWTQQLRQEEHHADAVIEKIIKALDQSFITPFDREDIHTLATRLDDVMDNMEETAYRLESFRIERPTRAATDLARIIRDCCGHIEKAVRLCRSLKDVNAIQKHLQAITNLENEADKIYRDSDSALFAAPPDILLLIKWRELYDWLERTVDACKAVGLVVSEIVIKGS